MTRYTSGGGGSGSSSYSVSVDSAKNGSVSVPPKDANKGTTMTITIAPNDGYELDDLTVPDKSGNTVKLTKKSNTKYIFTMPASKVTVEASFVESEIVVVPDTDLPFVDVMESTYYYDAVAWAVENRITARHLQDYVQPGQHLHPRPNRHVPVPGQRLNSSPRSNNMTYRNKDRGKVAMTLPLSLFLPQIHS